MQAGPRRQSSPIEFGYALITSPDDGHHPTDEWWFAEGLFSLAYLPNGLHTMFVRFFDVVEAPPWLRPNWTGLAVTWTMPALAWIARSSWRDPLVLALAGAAAAYRKAGGALDLRELHTKIGLKALRDLCQIALVECA